MADPTVDILLATHNGADYLAAQLDSIVAQTVANWRLIARDDGSCDGTPAILHAFQARTRRARPSSRIATAGSASSATTLV